jgi:hypothetical protein
MFVENLKNWLQALSMPVGGTAEFLFFDGNSPVGACGYIEDNIGPFEVILSIRAKWNLARDANFSTSSAFGTFACHPSVAAIMVAPMAIHTCGYGTALDIPLTESAIWCCWTSRTFTKVWAWIFIFEPHTRPSTPTLSRPRFALAVMLRSLRTMGFTSM